ncbi:hypothetical protein, partial [Erwinia typographi]|uniref:hypothetical protein n=1 Tax=Erwinia typographi TaxID=371042 RepID=UPI0018DC2123
VTGNDSGWLDAPVVVEASGSSLSGSVVQATVSIVPWTGMAAGDIVSLDWDGNVTGKYPLTQTVTGNGAGNTLTFIVPASQIKNNVTVGLNYTVQPADGSATLISWPLGLNVI